MALTVSGWRFRLLGVLIRAENGVTSEGSQDSFGSL